VILFFNKQIFKRMKII